MARAQFVVAMRLHAAVLEHAYGRPSVLMPYDRKIGEFGDLMKIDLRLEAAMLDDPPSATALLQSAWIDSQKQPAKETSNLRLF